MSPRTPPSAWYVVGVLAFCYAVAFVDRALVSVAGGPITHDLGLSDSQFGALHGTAFAALFCLCGLPLGWLADRADRRWIISTGLMFWTVLTAASGLARTYPEFFFARLGVGLGEACLVPAGMSLLGQVLPKDNMGKGVAVFLMGSTLGNIAALLGGGYLLGLLGAGSHLALPIVGVLAPWRLLFLLACPPGLLAALLLMTFREPSRPAARISHQQSISEALAHLGKHRAAYGILTAATACGLTLAQAQAAWMPLFFMRRFGLTASHGAVVVGMVFLVSAPIGQWVGGQLIDRLGNRGVEGPPHVVLALCGALCLPAAAVFCLSNRLPVVVVAYAIFIFLAFAATPAGLTGWQRLTPEPLRGFVIAVLLGAVTLVGVGLGPFLVGWLTDRVFQNSSAIGSSLLTVIGIAGAGGCALALAGRHAFARATEPSGEVSVRAAVVTGPW
jgi:MFS family permease